MHVQATAKTRRLVSQRVINSRLAAPYDGGRQSIEMRTGALRQQRKGQCSNNGFGNEMATIGQCVQISESEAGIVLEVATLIGGEPFYKVLRAFDDAEGGEVTYVVDAPAILPGGALCAECPLFYDGRCGVNQLDLAAAA